MKKTKFEEVSSLIDGEYTGDLQSPIDSLLKDAELRTAWQGYHELGDWMRGAADESPVRVNVVDRVRSAIDAEPILLFPASQSPVVVPPPQSRRWTQFAGMGIAAAVASVTVLLFQQPGGLQGPGEGLAVATAPMTSSVPVASLAAVGSDTSIADERLAGEAFQRKFDAYLASHAKQSVGHRAQGLLPFTTVVGYNAAPGTR